MSKAFDLIDRVDGAVVPVEQPGSVAGRYLDGVAQPQAPAPQQVGIDFNQPADAVRKQIAALPKGQRNAALKQWAQAYVAKERKQGGVGQYVDNVVRDVARGSPIGSWLDELNALTSSGLYNVGLGGAPYDETLAYQRARDQANDQNSTKLGKLPLIGDVTVGGAQKLAGGLLSGGALLRAGFGGINLARGETALPTIANLGMTGAVMGGLYGAGEGETTGQRLTNARIGAVAGGVLGPAAYVAGRGVAAGYQGARDGLKAVTDRVGQRGPLAPYDPGAVQRVQRAFTDDGLAATAPITGSRYGVEAARLGPEGMLADMGRNLTRQAGALAAQPGKGQAIVEGALRARDRLGKVRLEGATDKALGPPGVTVQQGGGAVKYPTAEEAVAGVRKSTQDLARPIYEDFYRTPVQITPELRGILNRAELVVPKIREKANKLLVADDVPLDLRKNNSAMLDYVKRQLDDAYQAASRAGDGNKARIISKIVTDLRDRVDNQLAAAGSTAWRDARSASGQGLRFEAGVKEGKSVLSNDKQTAADLRMRYGALTPEEQTGMRVGAREDIRGRMATARTAFDTQNERAASAGRRVLSSEETRAKLGILTDPKAARDLTRVLDAEGRFAATSNKVLGNSETAARQAAQKEFPGAIPTVDSANELGKKTLYGFAAEVGYRGLNRLLSGALDERRIRIAKDAAEMLIARGARRDDIANAILEKARGAMVSEKQRAALAALAAEIGLATRANVQAYGRE
jgi:hypothetical protein